METWRRNLYVMLATVFVGQASFTLVTPFLPFLLKSMAVTENLATWSGLAYSASSFTSALMAPIWGAVADKYGKRTQILRSGVGIALTYALYPFARTPLQFVCMRALTGFLSGFLPACTSLVATNTPEDKMGYALGLFQATNAAGTISGPLIGAIMVRLVGIPNTFRLSSAILFTFTVVGFMVLKEDVGSRKGRINVLGDIIEAFRNKQLVMVFICLFLVQAGIQVTQATLVLYIDKLSQGRDATVVSGVVTSIVGLGTVIGATYTARRNDRAASAGNEALAGKGFLGFLDSMDHRSFFMMGLMGSAVFAAAQGLWVAIVPLAVFRLLFGVFNGILTVAGNVLAATAVSREFRGRAFGVMNGVLPMGAVVGPLLGGIAGDSLGLGSAFYVSSAVFLASAGVLRVFVGLRRRAHASGLPASGTR
ncbi:MAG: MFS transporter [Bacillota bacterium]